MTKPVPGPDPYPRKPRLEVPRGACDCHCHIFGPASRFAYVPERHYTPPDASIEDFEHMLATLGIERAVIVQPSVYGTDNRCTEEAISRLGSRTRGVAVVRNDVSEAELRRLDRAGFRGMRFNLIQTGGSAPIAALETLARRIAPFGWHVQLYLEGRTLPGLEGRLMALPVPVVIDHLGQMEPSAGIGQPGMQALLRMVGTGRAWVKLIAYRFDRGGPPFARARPFVRALAAAAPERMLWGTDWPHPDIPNAQPGMPGPMPNDGDLVDALSDWFTDAAQIRRVLVDNPVELYGFDAPKRP